MLFLQQKTRTSLKKKGSNFDCVKTLTDKLLVWLLQIFTSVLEIVSSLELYICLHLYICIV